jgi:hypothetical protein
VKILPLKGYKSLRALNAFHALLLGLKMLPAYQAAGYEEFFASFEERTEAEKEAMLREAAVFVQLQQDEVEAVIGFATDPNGVEYGPSNLKNLAPNELHEIIVAVCMEIGRMKINLLSPMEKKSSLPSP